MPRLHLNRPEAPKEPMMRREQRDAEFVSNAQLQLGHREVDLEDHEEPNSTRPQGQLRKNSPEFRQMKMTLVEVFRSSKAVGILSAFFNLQLPPQLFPKDRSLLTEVEDRHYRALLLSNFKWAVEQLVKLAPKELGVFGNLDLNHSLASMTRRATMSEKSHKVIDLVQKRRANDALTYGPAEDANSEEGC